MQLPANLFNECVKKDRKVCFVDCAVVVSVSSCFDDFSISGNFVSHDLNHSVEVFEVDYAEVLADRLMRELGRRVTITAGKRKKTITFCYEDNEDLDRFLRRLCGDAFMDAE